MTANAPTVTYDEFLIRFMATDEAKRRETLAWMEQRDPKAYNQFLLYLKQNKGAVDEALGYEHWLRKFGPHSFTGTFAFFHHDFWKWYWPLAFQVKNGLELNLKDLVCLVPWGRDTGKSTHTEWAAIAEGAIVRKGYVLWVSAKETQAQEHVTSIRNRIEQEGLGAAYPTLGKPKVGAHGNKFGWGKEFLLTDGGWAVRPAGIDAYLRGGKVLDMRPSLIVLSDIDDINDSPYVVEQKERLVARSILPMGNAETRVIFDQNPIHANSVMNRILSRASGLLARRRIIGIDGGPIPSFRDIQIEHQVTDDGPLDIIVGGTPTWPDMDMKKCQAFLDRSGLDAFMAEYQHDMTVKLEERVLPEYDDRNLRLHVITWSQFEAKYGMRRIPSDWPCDAGLDIGYTTGHKSAWTFLSRVPQWAELAGTIFRYRGRTFTGVGIDEQSVLIRSELWPGETIQREFMSHEKLGERLVLVQKHGWHFQPCDSAKTAGIAQWRHALRADRSQPHPFHRDEKGLDGRWKLGRPAWFDIVDDDQFHAPRDDKGLKRHRDGAFNWRNVPEKLTEKGLTIEQPAKVDDDENDSTRMLTVGFGPMGVPVTQHQKILAAVPKGYTRDELAKRDIPPDQAAMAADMALYFAKKAVASKKQIPLVDEFGQPLSR